MTAWWQEFFQTPDLGGSLPQNRRSAVWAAAFVGERAWRREGLNQSSRDLGCSWVRAWYLAVVAMRRALSNHLKTL